MLSAAKRFAAWINKTPPGTIETMNTWYSSYSEGPGQKGTYAGKYGRTISFFLHLYALLELDQVLTRYISDGCFATPPQGFVQKKSLYTEPLATFPGTM